MFLFDILAGPAEAPPPYDPGDYFTGPPEGAPTEAAADDPPPAIDSEQPSTSHQTLATDTVATNQIQRTKSLPQQPQRPPMLPRQHSLPSRHRPPLPNRPPRSCVSRDTTDKGHEPQYPCQPSPSNQPPIVPNQDTGQIGKTTETSASDNTQSHTTMITPPVTGDDPPEYSLAVPGSSVSPPSLVSLASRSVPATPTESVSIKPLRTIPSDTNQDEDSSLTPKTETSILSGDIQEDDKPPGAIGGLQQFE